MKFYTLGHPIELIKTKYSNGFFDNLPVIGTPLGGVMKISPVMMHEAWAKSDELILTKNLDDAKLLRLFKVSTSSAPIDMDLIQAGYASGYPLNDYIIYEIEIDDKMVESLVFSKVREASLDTLKIILDPDFYKKFTGKKPDFSILPDFDVSLVKKEQLSPNLLQCHYINWGDGSELTVPQKDSGCTIS